MERGNRTYREEFYDCTDALATASAMRKTLARWDIVYNTIRPHQSLGYLTPAEALITNFPHCITKEVLSNRS